MTLPVADARKYVDDARARGQELGKALSSLWQDEAFGPVLAVTAAGGDVHHPFGGFHESGSAFRERGNPGSASTPASRLRP